jgi:DNA-binding transcriptional ArsR family regulator
VAAALDLLDDPGRVLVGLSPFRRRLLERLREPASASQLAQELGLGRQRVNYHLRELERAGLVELVEERPRRGFVERVLVSRAVDFVVDPAVLSGGSRAGAVAVQDRFAATHLVGVAADVVRDVARMQAAAERQGRRLLTFTLEAEVGLAEPADVERLADALTAAVAGTVAAFDDPSAPRRYRLVVGAHPAPAAGRRPEEAP